MKFFLKTTVFFVCVVLLGSISENPLSKPSIGRSVILSTVSAEDEDEEEDEEEEEDTDEESGSSSTSVTTKKVIQNVIEYKSVTRTVEVTPDEYEKDSDGDLLVDAIDPSPSIKQSEYFNDTDDDGVPNALDKHLNEDDFAFFDDLEADENGNGILDSYEQ